MNAVDNQHRVILQRIVRCTMLERGLHPDFSIKALAELDSIQVLAANDGILARGLTNLLWVSIDNYDSRDLDQLTVAEDLAGGRMMF